MVEHFHKSDTIGPNMEPRWSLTLAGYHRNTDCTDVTEKIH